MGLGGTVQGRDGRCLSGISEWVYLEYVRGRDWDGDIGAKAVLERRRKKIENH